MHREVFVSDVHPGTGKWAQNIGGFWGLIVAALLPHH